MKKTHIFIFSLLILLLCVLIPKENKAQTKRASLEELLYNFSKFPSYDSVVEVLCDKYVPADTQFIQLARKLDGWYVYISNVNTPDDFYYEKIFWSYYYKAFRFLPLPTTLNFDKKLNSELLKVDALRKSFEIFPLYGYEGWDVDIINYFGDYKYKTDSVLYCIAKAYSNLALSYIRRPMGYQYYKKKRPKDGKTHIEKFLEIGQKSLNTYQELLNQNSEFITPNGAIITKYSNEVMHVAQVLESNGETEKAKKILSLNNLYTPFMISNAKNFLNSCAPNAILFTNGDNDSYPLWYVQDKLNFRKDVTVINLHLLNTSWYIEYLNEKYGENKIFSIDEKLILENRFGRIFIIENDSILNINKPQDVNKMLEFILDDNDSTKFINEIFYIDYLPTTYLKMNVDKEYIKKYPSIDSLYKTLLLDEISWKLENLTLNRSQLLLLNIIHSNNWERPIYFTMTNAKNNFLGLNNYLRNDGLCLHLVPAEFPRKESDMPGNGFADGNVNYQILMNYFDFSKINQNDLDKESKEKMCRLYKNIIARTCVNLIANEEEEKAKQLLDIAVNYFKPEYVSPDYFTIPIAEILYYFEEIEIANPILKTIAVYYCNEIDSLSLNNDEKTKYLKYLQLLEQIASKNKKQKISNEIHQQRIKREAL